MTEIKLTKRYPHSKTEDIVDAYMRGWNNALDAVQNGKFHIAEQTEPQTETPYDNCQKCIHWVYDGYWYCECNECHYEPNDEPNCSEKPNNCEWSVEYAKEMLDTMSCEECGHWEHGAHNHYYCALLEMRQECCFESKDESTLMFANKPKDEPQTDGYMTEEQAEDYRKMLEKNSKVYGNIFKDEPQTDCPWK